MGPLFRIHENARLILRWLLITVPIAVAVGSIVALFLWLLDQATVTRGEHPWLLFLLPVAGLVVVFSYRVAGKNAEAGNNLILDEIHAPGAGVPGRMAPLVLAGTVVTHLFGGSAGREGTAVQIGGAISEQRIAVPKPSEVRHHLTLSELRNAQNRFVQWIKERRH